MIDINIKLPKDIIDISNEYIKHGKDIYLVGGCIRDFIQKKDPKDYDMVTNALPSESKEILKDFNVSDEQGKNFGVLRVYTKDEPLGYEIASYRKDISKGRDTKGEDQKVEMGNHITIEDDCNRRDLTINALFYDIKNKKIIDIVGGIDDIKNGIIRCVGDPIQRFEEDRLRICRVFRFASRIGGKIDKITSDAIKKDNRLRGISSKDDVSQERIWDEFKKAKSQSKNFNEYLNYYTNYDMWDQVFPESNINTNLVNSSNMIVIIANLFKNENLNGLVNKLTQKYKIETDIANKVWFLLSLNNFNIEDVFEYYKKKQQCSINNDTILEWLRVQNLKNRYLTKFIEYKPSISSQDLIDKGFKGRELGDKIKELESEKYKEMI